MIDGLLLIIAHATMTPQTEELGCSKSTVFYRHIYNSKYVYGVWLIEVYNYSFILSYYVRSLAGLLAIAYVYSLLVC